MNGSGILLPECTIEAAITANIVNYGEIDICMNNYLFLISNVDS
jgi:hypothetical protein